MIRPCFGPEFRSNGFAASRATAANRLSALVAELTAT